MMFTRAGFAAVALLSSAAIASAQGILTITPGRSAATAAGTGTAGYTGDGSSATLATVAKPSAIAYDASGNLYIADENNHVIREVVKSTGNIATVAGSGVEGYAGDGGAATSAQLDTPTGIAIDASGNLYIADSHNQRIREVSGGTISTIAGNGTKAFAGDGGVATSASLALPTGVAVDSNGNVYIADTDNHRIRKISGGAISTVAGDGEELYAGDGGAATAAALDAPTGVAVDSSGNIYIADRLNQRIREVLASSGIITTIAGSSTGSFSGGFSGDGGAATTATLAKPTGVSVDAAGNVYIADTNNQAVRQVGNGVIATIEGTGNTQGYAGDNGVATSAQLNAPKGVATDVSGNLGIADTLNQRVRSGTLPALAFGTAGIGVQTAIQTVTLSNTGTASLTVSTITYTSGFGTVTGGSCTAVPITLAAGTSCVVDIAYQPVSIGAISGSVIFSGAGDVPQKVLLSGTGVQATTSLALAPNATVVFAGQPVTLTATLTTQGGGYVPLPTQNVSFLDGGASLGSDPISATGIATDAGVILPTGSNVLTATYPGDANYAGSTSSQAAVLVEDFNFTLSLAGGGNTLVVSPGTTTTVTFNLAPVNGPFNFPVGLSATGLPAKWAITFNPPTVNLGSSATTFTMTVQVPATARLHRLELYGGSGVTLAVLLLVPFSRRKRSEGRKLRPMMLALFLLLGVGATAGLTGCGTGSGFFGQPQQTYTLTVTGTATNNGVTLQHSTQVNVTVE